VVSTHLYRLLASYSSAKSLFSLRSEAPLVTSSTHVAGLYPSRMSSTPSMACLRLKVASQRSCEAALRNWIWNVFCTQGFCLLTIT